MRNFKDKVVVVTGAAGGLGRALCQRFAQAGARIAVTDLNDSDVADFTKELSATGAECRGYALDVTNDAACHMVMESVVEDFGRLDVLVNNAGITHRSAFEQTQTQVFRKVMEVNFFGSLYCTQAALNSLIASRGLIVVVSSVAGLTPLLGRTGYSASKHALHGLFGSLRAELKPKGVGVTIVCPGFTATNIDKAALDFDGQPTQHPQSTVGKVALPDETAENIFQAASRDKPTAVMSAVGKLSWMVHRMRPALFEKLMTRSVGHELER